MGRTASTEQQGAWKSPSPYDRGMLTLYYAPGTCALASHLALEYAGADYETVIYEGYAQHGIPVIVECATDNVTRTVANIRHAFKHHGGNMGSTGSVAFMFQKQGVFRLDPEGLDRDALELELIDHGLVGLDDGESDKGAPQLLVRCAFNDFGTMMAAIEGRKLKVISTESEYVAQTTTELPDDKTDDVLKLVAWLEDDDDVQNVYTNLA